MSKQVKVKEVKDVDAFEYFTVSRYPLDNILTVHYQTVAKTGLSDIDFLDTKGDIVFQENVSELTVMVPKLGDYTIDRSNDFYLDVSIVNETVSPPKIVTRYFELTQEILNNAISWMKEKSPELVINNDKGVDIHFQTVDNSALSNSDYFETHGDIFFNSSSESVKFPVEVYRNSIAENGDTFSMLLNINDQFNIELIANYGM
jgi:hypothetical protein